MLSIIGSIDQVEMVTASSFRKLRVHRLHPVDDGWDSLMVSVRTESVGLDLWRWVAKFLRVEHRGHPFSA